MSARVLLVEDDPQKAMLIGTMLRAAWPDGLVIVHAHGLAEAVRELVEHGATCVLMDLDAHVEALDALAQLTAAALDAPVIALSEEPDDELALAALHAGAQDHLLTAELTPAQLARSLRFAVARRRSVAALALAALHDPLTELPNRALFVDRLRGALDRTRRTGTPVVVLFLDVDDFKLVNDSFGHSAGDALMTELARRFRGLLRPMDTVARFGGDEFTFLFEGLEDEAQAQSVAGRVSRAAAAPVELPEGRTQVSVSIGVTVVRDPDTEIEAIISHADAAMYRAKEVVGSRFEVSQEPVARGSAGAPPTANGDGGDRRNGDDDLEHDELEHALEEAMPGSQMRVHYQPRVSLNGRTGLVGFEALVRWEHPTRGLMEPLQFMPVAERSGLIVPIGAWVVGQALHQVHRWRQSRPGVTISVNLSPRQLDDPELLHRLAETIEDGGHDPSTLCLEVPERAVAAAPEVAIRRLAGLRDLGVRLAIDDFGTANSRAADLRQMQVDILKIDLTLVSRLKDGNGAIDDVGAAVKLGHTLGLCVVAEGVETDTQLATLRELGCDGAQGYLFSHPVPEEGVYSLLGG